MVLSLLQVSGFSVRAYGQSVAPIQFGVKDGLPSDVVYFVLEDRQGFLWFSTDKGVVRYDGFEFEVFTKADGLTDNEVFSMVEDNQGRIWFGTYNGIPGFFYQGQFYNPENYPPLAEIELQEYILHISYDQEGTVFLTGFGGGVYSISTEGEVRDYSKLYPGRMIGALELDGQNYLITNQLKNLLPIQPFDSVGLVPNQFEFIKNAGGKVLRTVQNSLFLSVGIGSNNITAWDLESKYIMSESPIQLPDSAKILNIAQDSVRGLLLIENNGIYEYGWETLYTGAPPTRVIPLSYTPSFAYYDLRGDLWITTLGDGIILLKQSLVKPFSDTLPFQGQLVDVLSRTHEGASEDLLLLFSNGDIWSWNQQGIQLKNQLEFSDWLSGLYRNARLNRSWSPNHYWVYGENGLFHVDLGAQVDSIANGAFYIRDSPRGILFTSAPGSLFWPFSEGLSYQQNIDEFVAYLKTASRKGVPIDFKIKTKIGAVLSTQDGSLFAGYQHGIGLFDEEIGQFYPRENSVIKTRVTTLKTITLKNGDSWMLAGGDALLAAISTQQDTIMADLELIQNYKVSDLVLVGDTLLLAGTDDGLLKLSVDFQAKRFFFQGKISDLVGLPSPKVEEVHLVQDSIWIITQKGAVTASLDNLLNASNQKLKTPKIMGLWIDEIPVDFDTDIELAPDFYSIRFKLASLDFENLGQVVFQYRLGAQSPWLTTNSNQLQFPDLNSGTYSLQVRSVAFNGQYSEVLSIPITVLRYWWQWPWLWLLLGLSVGLLVLGIVRIRNRRLNEKAKAELKMAQMELTALKAQMNPHFIFNALSSIQRFILASDTRSANEYLTKYSRLTRLVLNHSDKTLVPLEDEIQLLENYIALECLRLSHRFTYEITVDDALDPKRVELPALLLQIFIENAVWHGLSPLDTPGHLQLSFKKVASNMLILLKDNGIGRQAAGERNPRKGESRGGKLVLDKLTMLNETVYQHQASIDTVDLFDPGQEPAGTEVRILIPIVHA